MRKMIKFLTMVLVFCWGATQAQTVAKAPAGWNGTGGSISTLAELRWLSETPDAWNEAWKLAADIDAAETRNWNISGTDTLGFSPIGDAGLNFTGSFDGQNHVIKNLYISRKNSSYVGFIGYTGYGIVILNLGLVNCDVTGSSCVGAVVGYFYYSTIKNCFSTGIVKSTSSYSFAGGLIGSVYYNQELSKCFSLCTVQGPSRVGGLIGSGTNFNMLSECYAAGSVSSSTSGAAVYGIIGSCSQQLISRDCYFDTVSCGINKGSSYPTINFTGLSTADFADKSKLFPENFDLNWEIRTITEIDSNPRPYLKSFLYDYSVSVEQSPVLSAKEIVGNGYYNNNDIAEITASPRAGYAFVGWVANGDTISKSNTMSVTVNKNVTYTAVFKSASTFNGGDGTIENPYQIANLEQLEYLSNDVFLWNKHFVLVNDIDATDTKNWNNGAGFSPIGDYTWGSRQKKEFNGSLDGQGHVISNLYINRPNEQYVGFFGYIYSVTIKNLGLENIEVIGRSNVAALVGNSTAIISDCYVTGHVSGYEYIAGFAANISYGSISNCFSSCSVSGTQNYAGFAYNIQSATVSNIYSSGNVQKSTYAYGLFGPAYNNSIKNCFYDVQSSGQSVGAYQSEVNLIIEGLNTADFNTSNTFTGWDFDNTWTISTVASIDANPRPYLQMQFADYQIVLEVEPAYAGTTGTNQWAVVGNEYTIEAEPSFGYKFLAWVCGSDTVSKTSSYTFTFSAQAKQVYRAIFVEDFTFAKGAGTEQNPFQIETLDDLKYLSSMPSYWDKHFKQIADIDATDTKVWNMTSNDTLGFSPIGGIIGQIEYPFTGSYNGQEYTIAKLYIHRDADNQGLFGIVKHGEIENVNMTNASIFGRNNVGIIGGNILDTSSINNCYVSGIVLSAQPCIGGMVGIFSGSVITNSSANVEIQGSTYIGGLLGFTRESRVSNCSSVGSVKGTSSSAVGGLIGKVYSCNVDKCYSLCTVEALNGSSYSGGLIGYSDERSTVSNCFAKGMVNAYYAGGLIGLQYSSEIINCYATGEIKGTTIGNIVGRNNESDMVNTYFDTVATSVESCFGENDGSSYATALSSSKFGVPASFKNWDFNDIWEIATISEIDSIARPYLKGMLHDIQIEVLANNKFAGTVSGSSFYDSGEQVSVAATAKAGFAFTGWKINGTVVSTLNPYIFTASNSVTIIAEFEESFQFEGGDGTENDPFQIATLQQLEYLSNVSSLWDKHFILLNNIDAEETATWNITAVDTLGFSPIGGPDYSWVSDRDKFEFTGSFDGNNHVIYNLTINRPKEYFVGMFGYVSAATIHDLGLVKCHITGYAYSGGLIGNMVDTTIVTNCYTTGIVRGSEYVCGGLVGDCNSSEISLCYSNTTVGSDVCRSAGGLISGIYNSKVTNCYASGNVSGDSYVGAFAGSIGNSTIVNAYATGVVIGRQNFGGFAGGIGTSTVIENCYFDSVTTKQISGFGSSQSTVSLYPLNSSQFASKSNFENWDFTSVWTIDLVRNIDSVRRPYLNTQFDFNVSNNEIVNPLAQNNIEVSVFPNPTSGSIKIVSKTDAIEKVQIVDITGKTVIEKQLNNNELSVDLSSCNGGVYIVKVQTEKESFNVSIIKK